MLGIDLGWRASPIDLEKQEKCQEASTRTLGDVAMLGRAGSSGGEK